ncbi:MAG: hypothetical protein CMJ83_16520 [Planctomycetes bacterium]|nr:hypothetical protein [Planctomycetota bacterium]
MTRVLGIATLAVVCLTLPLPAQGKETHGGWGQHVGPQVPDPASRTLDWPQQQMLADAHEGWQAWASEHPGWQAIFDSRTGQLVSAYGPGIPVIQARADQHQIAVVALGLKEGLLNAIGVNPIDYELQAVMRGGRLYYVHFIQRFGAFRVRGGRLTLRIDDQGRLVMWGGRFVDTTSVVPAATLPMAAARNLAETHIARLGFVTNNTQLTFMGAEPVVYVKDDRTGLAPTATWLVKLISDAPRADWMIYVDVQTGAIVEYWNDIRECGCCGAGCDHGGPATGGAGALEALAAFANVMGFVQGTTHEGLLPHQSPQNTNFPDIRVTVNGSNVITDVTGFYSFNGGGTTVSLSSTLDGPWVNGSNSSGTNASISTTVGTGTFNVTFANSTIGERDMVFFANKTHARLKDRAPAQTLLDTPITARANVTTGSCNAFYSPAQHSINFYAQSGGCINTGTSASVVSHEYGHGISTRIYSTAGSSVPGYMGEGLSDCVGGATEDTSIVGSGFSGIGTQVRNMNNGCQYPSSCGTAIHQRGLVIGGSYWHTRVQFNNAMGQAGKDLMDSYLFQSLSGAPQDEIAVVMEMLLLDDNDGNLANGTPNVSLFHQGFTIQHGVPFPLQLVTVGHQPLVDTLDQLQPYEIRATASSITGSNVSNLTLFWRAGAPNFTPAPMTQSGGTWVGFIPNQAGGATVEYYLSAIAGSNSGTSPAGAPAATHRFRTALSSAFYAQGFEGISGWTSQQVQTQNDWHNIPHGNPNHASDPATAFEGLLTYGNDLVPASNWNGDYAASVNNHLSSSTINCTGRTGVTLVYRRWLTVEDGFYDQARILVSNNNGASYIPVWQNAVGSGTQHHVDTTWVEHSVNISAIADNQPNVRIRFQLISDAGLQFGGWNIDDLRLEAANQGASQILDMAGSTSVGNTFSLLVNGGPGDLVAVGAGASTSPSFYGGLGTMSLNVAAPAFILLTPGAIIPASGQVSYSFLVPPAVGATIHFQGVLVSSVNGAFTISNVLSATVTP